MRALILLACLVVGCLAQKPQPCSSPTLMSGSFALTVEEGSLTVHGNYTYDALGERLRLQEVGEYNNKTLNFDAILLYKQGIMYKLNYKNSTCNKERLGIHFHPLMIPKNATFVDQAVLGSSTVVGQGLRVNSWAGELNLGNNQKGFYLSTVTDFGCIPVSSLFRSDKTEMVAISFFNNVAGIADPQHFVPPPFCNNAQLQPEQEEEEELVGFFSLF